MNLDLNSHTYPLFLDSVQLLLYRSGGHLSQNIRPAVRRTRQVCSEEVLRHLCDRDAESEGLSHCLGADDGKV